MKHIAPISQRPVAAQDPISEALQGIVLLLFTALFSDWDNFPSVIQNLRKYYGKI
jgi:hypothetical protein